ncbi:MAG: hypothetical protein OEZ13_06355 [Spirochaetia bacterium]|nr:hypothetical protein [Spirochaetia bacterium]
MKRKIFYFIPFLFVFNCLSTSNFKTGKVLGQKEDGSAQTSFSAGAYSQGIITPEIMYRSAIDSENFDMGLKVFPIGIEIDAKYQLLKSNRISGAGDFGITYVSFPSGDKKLKILTLSPTFLFTLDITNWLSATIAPKLLYTIISESYADSDVPIASGLTYGGSLNLDIGGWLGVMPELGLYYTGDLADVTLGVITYGVMLRFDSQ